MAFTLSDIAIKVGLGHFPWMGAWTLEAELVGEEVPAEGAAVQVVLGDVTASATVRRSGSEHGRVEVYVVGGSDGWAKMLPRRAPYRRNAGVPLQLVVEDLARDVGETAVMMPDLAGLVLGYAWTRPVMPAASALRLVRVNGAPVPWWVDLDGRTRFGARPRVTPAAPLELVSEARPAQRSAVIRVGEDRVSAMLPGVLLDIPGLPSGPVRSTRLDVSSDSVSAEVRL